MKRTTRAVAAAMVAGVALWSCSGADAAPIDWYMWVGNALGPGVSDGRPDAAFNGSSNALDFRNWQRGNPVAWATNMTEVTTTYGNRWGFTATGGFSEVGGTGASTWFTGIPSIYYPGVGSTAIRNPALAVIGTGQTLAFPAGSDGAIGGDMTVDINGGTLTCGKLTDNGTYGAWLPPFNSYTSGYMWPNKIRVSNGGTFRAANVNGFEQGGTQAAGNITLEIRRAATVDLDLYTAGHTLSAGGLAGVSSSYGTNGRGGGGLTLEGAGGTITIDTLNLLPSAFAPAASRYYYNGGAVLRAVLDGTVSSRAFNTVQANVLEIDPARGLLGSPVNVEIAFSGYTPQVGDVIPLVTATTIQHFNGTTLVTGSLGQLAVNGVELPWSPSTEGGQEVGFDVNGYTLRLLDHDPANATSLGLFAQVVSAPVPEPAAVALLAVASGLAGFFRFRRRR